MVWRVASVGRDVADSGTHGMSVEVTAITPDFAFTMGMGPIRVGWAVF